MADEAEKQPVADEAKGAATEPAPADSGAQDDNLDVNALLEQWETDEAPEPAKPEPEKSGQTAPTSGSQDTDVLIQWAKEQREKAIAEETERDVQDAVGMLKDGWDDAPPDRLLKGELYRAAQEDPRFVRAFQSRRQYPDRWKRLLRAQQRELKAEFQGRPDKAATDDRRAVEAAVRSSSNAPPPAKGPSKEDWAKMSDEEFRQKRAELLDQ